jgi:Cu+-exporting ATPase
MKKIMASHTGPICGMQVDEKNAAGQSNYQGQDYYFCSSGCKSKFDQDPQQYAGKSGEATSSSSNR